MNDILDIEIILKKQKYHPIYNIGTILLIILLSFIYITSIYTYKTYYKILGKTIDGKIELLVKINDLKYITQNNQLTIDNLPYKYNINKISEELYIDENFENYQYVYLNIEILNTINNYVYEIKIEKENKKIIEYLKEYL